MSAPSAVPAGLPGTSKRDAASDLEIHESPIELSGAGPEPFSELERDLRALMRDVGESRYALEESTRSHREQTRALLLGVLDAADTFDRVFGSVAARSAEVTAQMKVWLSNFRTARLLLDRVLADEGLTRVAPNPADVFDPHRHRVTGTVPGPDRPDGAIVEVAVTGWLWKGVLLRKSGVVIVYNGGNPLGSQPPDS